MPPAPVQAIEKVLSPTAVIVTASEPEVPVWLVHDAEQEVALEEDQVSVEVFSTKTEVGSAEKLTVGAGVVGGVGVLPPPPPPPPHETINKTLKVIGNNFFKNQIPLFKDLINYMYIKLTHIIKISTLNGINIK